MEAKLRETEERLKEKQASPAATRVQQQAPPAADRAHHAQATSITSESATVDQGTGSSVDQAPSASTMSYWRPPMPGALPETPGDSRQNSYLGDRQDTS